MRTYTYIYITCTYTLHVPCTMHHVQNIHSSLHPLTTVSHSAKLSHLDSSDLLVFAPEPKAEGLYDIAHVQDSEISGF